MCNVYFIQLLGTFEGCCYEGLLVNIDTEGYEDVGNGDRRVHVK